MRILVTGGSGFVGRTFVKAALSAGHDIMTLSRERQNSVSAGEHWAQGSIQAPPWEEIESFAPDVCIHLAWIATPGVYLNSPENEHWLNWSVDFIERVCKGSVRRVVCVGTCIEYKITGLTLREDSAPLEPNSIYARSKHALHKRLRRSLAGGDVTLTWARLFYPYGPGEHPARLASSLLQKLRAGESVAINHPLSVKDYLYIDDVASGLLALAQAGFDGPVNLGSGDPVTVGEIARRLGELAGRPDLVRLPDAPVPDPLDFVVADSTRLRSIGWNPSVDLPTGLARLAQTLRS